MKKLIIPIVIVMACLVGYYAYSHQDNLTSVEKFVVVKSDNIRLMDFPKDKVDFSPMLSAFFYVRLREGDLPMTFPVSIISQKSVSPDEELLCTIRYRNVVLKAPLEILSVEQKETSVLYSAMFTYNLATLLKEKGEDEIIEWMKVLPASPQKIIASISIAQRNKKNSFPNK
jgi:hypothetical protein